MAEYTLIVGNKAYSSWSLRGWLAAQLAGIDFDEQLVRLSEPGSRAALLGHSPAGKVPVLKHGERVIWDSLAIIEYLAEQRPAAGLWPVASEARALARSIAAEMHSGFQALRSHMPMNLRKSLPGRGMAPGVPEDIARISAIWQDCRRGFGAGGPFLFGQAGAADAMYAPVATRFRTYGVALDPVASAMSRRSTPGPCCAPGRRRRSRSPGSSPRTRSTERQAEQPRAGSKRSSSGDRSMPPQR